MNLQEAIEYKDTMNVVQASNYERDNATYLQGLGYCTGTPAGELKVGDTMIWNGGGSTKVVEIYNETKCFITIDEIDIDGNVWKGRKLKKSRIVARPVDEIEIEC